MKLPASDTQEGFSARMGLQLKQVHSILTGYVQVNIKSVLLRYQVQLNFHSPSIIPSFAPDGNFYHPVLFCFGKP